MGSLVGDLTAFVDIAARHLADPTIAAIVVDLFSHVARSAEFADTLHACAGVVRRARAVELVRRAVERGELPSRCDEELAAELRSRVGKGEMVTPGDAKDASSSRLLGLSD